MRKFAFTLLFALPLLGEAQEVQLVQADTVVVQPVAKQMEVKDTLETAELVVEQSAKPVKPKASQPVKSQPKFGYLSYSEVIRLMPEYAAAQEELTCLQEKYDAELKRSDKEFNRKFSDFLQGQKEFPENIMLKRQKELQELMEQSVQFKDEMKELLEQTRQRMIAPVMRRLDEAIAEVAAAHHFEYVLNTDNNSYPYINQEVGTDITLEVKAKLGVSK